MNENISSALKNWIPFKLFEEGSFNYCRWLYLGDKKVTEPFFDETVAKCWKLPENSRSIRCISSVEMLPEWAQQIETISPTIIIFHISRCGSTVVSQLLGLQPANIVLSEVPFFDELLRWGNSTNQMEQALPLLKGAIDLYGAKRNKESKHLIVKADSWHIHFYHHFRKLYPQVPFILLYRKPDEVIRSQQKKRGMQSIPGLLEPEIFGFKKNEIMHTGLDEYMGRVIETYLQAFVKILNTDKLALPVNYNEGALNIVKKAASFAGFTFSEKELTAMQERAAFHGKYPEQVFEEAALAEQVPPFLKQAFEWYSEVEKIRMAVTEGNK